jgi:hypothetical protein
MAWLNYAVALAGIAFAVYMLSKLALLSWRWRRWEQQNKADWDEVQRLIKDPDTREQGVQRYIAKLQEGPPRING